MNQYDHNTEDHAPVPFHEELDRLMARGRRLRSEAFYSTMGSLFHAPGRALDRLSGQQPAKTTAGMRRRHA